MMFFFDDEKIKNIIFDTVHYFFIYYQVVRITYITLYNPLPLTIVDLLLFLKICTYIYIDFNI